MAEGDLLLVVNRAGQAFTTTFTITPAAGSLDGSFTIDETTALTTVADLVGGPFAGEVWKAYVTVNDVTTVHSYPVTGSDTLADVAAQLAIDINTNAPAEFTVTTEGEILVIINRVGTSFSTGYKITSATAISDETSSAAADSAVITLSGTPVAGETWEIDLSGGSYDYVVAADDRLSDIVAALVDEINNASSAFTAAVKGISFVVVNDSATFTPTFTITPFNGYAIASPDSAATVTLSGTPEANEIWTVNLGTSTHSHRVTISQSLADIAAALAEDINANAAGDFTATTEGDVLIIADRAGSSFTTTFAITVRSAYAIDNSTATTTTAVFTAAPVEGEVWTVDLGTSTHSHTVDSGETVEDIVLSLAADINTNAANNFAAVSNGDTLVIVNIAGSTFTTTTTITPSGSLAVDDATAASTMATFTGTPVANEIWYLTAATPTETHSFSHAIAGGDTLADIATAIAAAINADPAASDYTAMVLGDTVIIANVAGDAFTTTFDITLADGYTSGSVVVDAATAIAATAQLTGLPAEGEVWSILLSNGDGSELLSTHSYIAGETDDVPAVALALATDINAAATDDFTATVEGSTVLIVNRSGVAFTTDVQITPVRRPAGSMVTDAATATTTTAQLGGLAVEGVVWSIMLGIDGVTNEFSYMVNAGDTLADIAAALVDAINASIEAADFTAIAAGDSLMIVNRIGEAFTTTLKAQFVTRGDGYAMVTVDYDMGDDALRSRLQSLYGFEGIRVAEGRTAGNVTYTISFVDGQAGIDFDQIEWAETREETGLIPGRGASVDVSIRTLRDGSPDNPQINNVQTIAMDAGGGTFTLSFMIEDDLGRLVEHTSGPIPYNASALDLFKIISPILNPNGATIDIDPEFDRITRNPARPYTDNVSVRKYDGVFQITFRGEHSDLLIHDIDTTQLAGMARKATVTLSGVTAGSYVIDDATAAATAVALSGTPASGELWQVLLTVGVFTNTFNHIVVSSSITVAEIATALAAEINLKAGADFTATTQGDMLIIVNTTGTEFSTALAIVPTGGSGSYTIDDTTAITTTADLSGTPLVDEIWTITLDDSILATTHSYKVAGGDSPEDIAAALAGVIIAEGPPEYTATVEGNVLTIENLAGNTFTASFTLTPVTDSTGSAVVEVATAIVDTSIDGINYYTIETLNIDLGAGDDVFNVRGTNSTTTTNLDLADGDERIYISSTADFDLDTSTDFLFGHLHDVRGTINIDAGAGVHELMISDEGATIGDDDVLITDSHARATLREDKVNIAEIYVTGLAQGSITYKTDLADGDFAPGITIWAGWGDDTIEIDGTHWRDPLSVEHPSIRTVTTLNTGLGDDNVTVDLDSGEDGFFVLNTQGPYDDYTNWSDRDTVDGSASTLPLVIFGGQDDDDLTGGTNVNIIFGDRGRVLYFTDDGFAGDPVTVLGHGGPGDKTDGLVHELGLVFTVDPFVGGNDTLFGGLIADIILAGNNGLVGDYVDAGEGNNIVFGDHGVIELDQGILQSVMITDIDYGGNDQITTGPGNDIILGGTADDTIYAGAGNDLVFGDHGYIATVPGGGVDANALPLSDAGLNDPFTFTAIDTQNAHDGGNDIIHGQDGEDIILGQQGDDFIYGMTGSDILFGDGQDDDLIGGYGHDWISGGAGIDGVLGDDGRIYTSRNSNTGEPLYGIAGFADSEMGEEIDTPGNIQQAVINESGKLKKTVNITPFKLGDPEDLDYGHELFDPTFADDIIYGGWGDDFLHGGDGDDAISGAEALPVFYNAPVNNGNVLRFGEERQGEFAAYNEYDPWHKVYVDENGIFTDETGSEFLLNFDAGEGLLDTRYDPAGTLSDGDDVIFGDIGNDWLVGGSGKDHLYGGYGSDLLNVDDDHDTNAGANDTPDTDATYEDIAYGGAGRDVLIANTGGDRLIDWAGEFNSYVVPFAPFGAFTVSRALQPGLMRYLYDLSASDGADPTRAADTGADAARNGEPEGEMGLANQRDRDWQKQTGAPDDPQPGNIPGGARDVMRSATFNSGNMAPVADCRRELSRHSRLGR